MKTSKYAMQAVGYFLLSQFKEWTEEGRYVPGMLEEVGYEEYHNFWKCRLPFEWYGDVSYALDVTPDDLLVEVACIRGNHAEDLHYHKISHAICIVLGEETGFPATPSQAAVQINKDVMLAYEDKECYFPTGCHHTFYGEGEDPSGDLYFISIQSPPLLTEDNDDFYWVNRD